MKKLLKIFAVILVCSGAIKILCDTTTTRYGLTKPDVGSTNWGPKLNTNFDLLDSAASISQVNNFSSSNTFNGPVFIKGSNANGLRVGNAGEQYTEIDLLNSTTQKVNLYWDNTNANFVFLIVTGSFTFTGGPIVSVGDIYTAAYQNYTATSTVVGYSSFTTELIYYKKVGNMMWVWFGLVGTSNATTVSFTLPFTSTNTLSSRVACTGTDNGTVLTTPALAILSANSSTVNVFKDFSSAVWTSTGTKSVVGEFFYHTNQ